jgi:hypothetical protein
MGLGRTLYHSLSLRLSDCIGEVFVWSFSGFFPTKALRSSSPSSLVVCSRQNRCCVRASGSCAGCHCNGVLEFRLILQPSSAARACENAEPQTCWILWIVHRAPTLFWATLWLDGYARTPPLGLWVARTFGKNRVMFLSRFKHKTENLLRCWAPLRTPESWGETCLLVAARSRCILAEVWNTNLLLHPLGR